MPGRGSWMCLSGLLFLAGRDEVTRSPSSVGGWDVFFRRSRGRQGSIQEVEEGDVGSRSLGQIGSRAARCGARGGCAVRFEGHESDGPSLPSANQAFLSVLWFVLIHTRLATCVRGGRNPCSPDKHLRLLLHYQSAGECSESRRAARGSFLITTPGGGCSQAEPESRSISETYRHTDKLLREKCNCGLVACGRPERRVREEFPRNGGKTSVFYERSPEVFSTCLVAWDATGGRSTDEMWTGGAAPGRFVSKT